MEIFQIKYSAWGGVKINPSYLFNYLYQPLREWNARADPFVSQITHQWWTGNEYSLAHTHDCTSGISKAEEDLTSSKENHTRDWQMQIIRQEGPMTAPTTAQPICLFYVHTYLTKKNRLYQLNKHWNQTALLLGCVSWRHGIGTVLWCSCLGHLKSMNYISVKKVM